MGSNKEDACRVGSGQPQQLVAVRTYTRRAAKQFSSISLAAKLAVSAESAVCSALSSLHPGVASNGAPAQLTVGSIELLAG